MQNFPELDKSKFYSHQDVEVSAKVMNKFRSTAKPIYESKFFINFKRWIKIDH